MHMHIVKLSVLEEPTIASISTDKINIELYLNRQTLAGTLHKI